MKRVARLCLRSVRANVVPGLALQLVAAVVVGVYYLAPDLRYVFDWIERMKLEYGYGYSAITTGFFGGLVPYLYLLSAGRVKRGEYLAVGAFTVLFWSWRGVEVDFLYRMQALMFGAEVDFATVAKKVLFDELVYSPFWSVPVTALLYRWRDCGFSWRLLRRGIDREFWSVEIPAMMAATWSVWFPGTVFVYSMPAALQLPLFTLVLCFYVLLVSAVGTREKPDNAGNGACQDCFPST